MRVGVFGGSGFIGRAVTRQLESAGHEVLVFSRRAEDPRRKADVTRPLRVGQLSDLDAVVNLVGIKRPSPGQSFEAAHVDAIEHLIGACERDGVRRLIHVSVSAARPAPDDAYLDTKHRGEQRVRESSLDWTVLRPGVVYGPGDDMLTNLCASLRHLPLFPAPGLGRGPLMPVDVEDVALAVTRSLAREQSIGQAIDVVGPERLSLAELVGRVARALSLPTLVLPVPSALMRPAAAVLEALLADPPVTRAQLGMLSDGVVGDRGPARELLALETRPLDPARIVASVRNDDGELPPALFGLSLRADPDPGGWPRGAASMGERVSQLAWAIPAAIVAIDGAALWFRDDPAGLWWGMLAANLLLVPLFLLAVRPPLRELASPGSGRIGWGVGFFAAMYGGGWALLTLLRQLEGVEGQIMAIYGAAGAIPTSLALLLLPLVIVAEDLVWRCCVTLPLARRFGAGPGIALAGLSFGVAHLWAGPPLLVVAAVGCGLLWSWLAVRTRSLLAPLMAHLLWDFTALWLLPYA